MKGKGGNGPTSIVAGLTRSVLEKEKVNESKSFVGDGVEERLAT